MYLLLIVKAGLAAELCVIDIESEGQELVQGLQNGTDWTHIGNQ